MCGAVCVRAYEATQVCWMHLNRGDRFLSSPSLRSPLWSADRERTVAHNNRLCSSLRLISSPPRPGADPHRLFPSLSTESPRHTIEAELRSCFTFFSCTELASFPRSLFLDGRLRLCNAPVSAGWFLVLSLRVFLSSSSCCLPQNRCSDKISEICVWHRVVYGWNTFFPLINWALCFITCTSITLFLFCQRGVSRVCVDTQRQLHQASMRRGRVCSVSHDVKWAKTAFTLIGK